MRQAHQRNPATHRVVIRSSQNETIVVTADSRRTADAGPSGVLYDGSLVVAGRPPMGALLPDRRPLRPASVEDQGVRQQIDIRGQFLAVKVGRLPLLGLRSLETLLQHVEHVRTAVASPRCARLPVI